MEMFTGLFSTGIVLAVLAYFGYSKYGEKKDADELAFYRNAKQRAEIENRTKELENITLDKKGKYEEAKKKLYDLIKRNNPNDPHSGYRPE